MDQIRYIHAADLHLDTPFKGLEKNAAGHLGKMLHQATFTALERLVQLCLVEKPDFLVLAGDIYDQEERSIRAQLALRDACGVLNENGIPVYIVHGNHDPFSSRIASLKFPPNTIIFGTGYERHVFMRAGEQVAIIHGISHIRDKENQNLARLFTRDDSSDCFQLGLLHCMVEGSGSPDRYAPCSIEDLKAANLDAWALGHVHERNILCSQPFIAYSGNTQGLHINEPGPRGCYVVNAKKGANEWHCEAQFRPLCSIMWEKLNLELEGLDTLDNVEQKMVNCIDAARGAADPNIQAIIARLHLQGRTSLNKTLRSGDTLKDIGASVQNSGASSPTVWLKDFDVATRDYTPPEDFLERDDLQGECARLARELSDDEAALSALCDSAFEPLLGNTRFRRIAGAFDQENLRLMLKKAENICQETLESR